MCCAEAVPILSSVFISIQPFESKEVKPLLSWPQCLPGAWLHGPMHVDIYSPEGQVQAL